MTRWFEKTVDIVKRIDYLTRLKATGTPNELAQKLKVSPSTIYEYIIVMKTTLNAPISYSRVRRSYYYKKTGSLKVGFDPED